MQLFKLKNLIAINILLALVPSGTKSWRILLKRPAPRFSQPDTSARYSRLFLLVDSMFRVEANNRPIFDSVPVS